jgi:hypothetical protein
MILIQLILIVGFLLFLWQLLANPLSYNVRAWTKILAILFVIIGLVAIAFPNITNKIAHIVGVSTGANLLIYILTLAFIFAMFNSYTNEKRLQKRIVLLARKIAIIEANQRNKDPKN